MTGTQLDFPGTSGPMCSAGQDWTLPDKFLQTRPFLAAHSCITDLWHQVSKIWASAADSAAMHWSRRSWLFPSRTEGGFRVGLMGFNFRWFCGHLERYRSHYLRTIACPSTLNKYFRCHLYSFNRPWYYLLAYLSIYIFLFLYICI